MWCLFDKKDNFMLNKTKSYVRGVKLRLMWKITATFIDKNQSLQHTV